MSETPRVSDADKAAIWQACHNRQPCRVPVNLVTNARVVMLNAEWNREGVTYRQAAEDPRTHVRISLLHQLYRRQVIHRYCDHPTEPPDVWPVELMIYNIYDAAYFGAPVYYYDDQVPDTEAVYADDADREKVFEIDVERPLDNPFIRRCLAFHAEMAKVCEGMRFEGRPVRLMPWALLGTDGPVTVGMNLRGANFMLDLADEDDYADRLMAHIVTLAINRRRAFHEYWGEAIRVRPNGLADDSAALLSTEMYTRRVMPHHRRYYQAGPANSERDIHMCGNAQRLFPSLREQLGVTRFDTGFPLDHGSMRREVGRECQISGGPEVALLISGSPEAVYRRTASILQSGVKDGGRFILREGNNLPPNVPEANLEAMYRACLDHGWY